jgi:AsmA protein
MKKGLKIAGKIVLSVVLLVLAAALILPYLISLDKYKGMVVEKMERALHRDCSMGKLRITILPTLGASIEDVVVANAPGFSSTPLLSLQSLKVRVKIIPLLFGKKEIAGLVLSRPVIFIEKDPQGRLNIPGMEEAGKGEKNGKLVSGKVKTEESKALKGLYLARASLKEGKLIYLDRSAASPRRTEIERIDFDLTDLSLGKKIRYKLSLQWSPGEVSLDGWVGPLGNTIDLNSIPVQGEVQANLSDLGAFMKKMSGGEAAAMLGSLKASLNFGGNMGSSIKAKGEVLLKQLSIGEKGARTVERLDITIKPEVNLAAGGDQLQLSVALQLDTTPFLIHGQFKDLQKKPVGHLTLAAPQGINLEQLGTKFPTLHQAATIKGVLALTGDLIYAAQGTPLLSLEANSSHLDIALAEKKKGAEKATSPQKKPTEEKKAAPRSPFDARGKIMIKEGRFQETDFHDFLLTAEMKGGEVRITQFTCAAFDGMVQGDGSFNIAHEPSPFSIKTKITGVDANALVSTLASAKGMLKGKLSGDVSLGGAGFTVETLKKNLVGKGTVQIKEGELTWLNLIGRIVQAVGGKGGEKDKTTFEDITSSFTVKNGMVNFPNILIAQKDMALKLWGDIGLDSILKMEGEAHLPSSLTGDLSGKGWKFFADNRGRLTVPFTLTGTLNDPKVGISTKFVEQGVKGVLQQFLQKKK